MTAFTLDNFLKDLLHQVVREELRIALAGMVPSTDRLADAKGEDEFINVAEAGRLAKVHPATIRTWIGKGHLSRYRAGRVLRVKVSELRAFLARPEAGHAPIDLEERASLILAKSAARKKPSQAAIP